MSETPETEIVTPKARKRWGRALLRIALLAAIAWGAWEAGSWWYAKTGRYVTTENAYVKAPIIAVSPPIDGRAVEVLVGDNQPVTQGELLFRIDPAPYQAQLRMAEARRATVINELLATKAELGQLSAEMAEIGPRVKFFAKEVERQQRLVKSYAGTEAKLDEMQMERDMAEQRLRSLREKRQVVIAKLGGLPDRRLETHPRVLEVDAEIERVKLDLAYTEIHAPVSGIVTRMKLQAGEWVEADSPTFGIIGTGLVWIEANLKETQLGAITLGQPVEVRVDAYPDAVWEGKIESLSPATGAEFSALPPQNASGNWVKVVQRLPVRIAVEQPEGKPQLRAGMSAVISVDTGRVRDLGNTLSELTGKWIGKARAD
ncbi:HlyD family secretion protein [Nisaea acidiphila]|uniref:HlyD family secretion protein n=1 Tax=Nisaea acidiphila TaxID=1862145 RepID=A0A9J7AW74_9PROT|nr:HlyD family secretion protein [Nisaea acidiphila]UUX51607.1 HlyD family secretion protein [Nisaea acidiphila]